MVDSARARKLAKRIAAIVATELEHQVKDPRLAMITVTAATVTPDLREATVFYTVYGDDEAVQSTEAALVSATGVLRSAVGKQTGIKFTPTLAFTLDRVPDTSRHIEELLAVAKAADAQLAQQAADKSYAGDADPYRVPRDDSGDTEPGTESDPELGSGFGSGSGSGSEPDDRSVTGPATDPAERAAQQ